jgi:putative protease
VGLDQWSARAFALNFDRSALLGAIDRAHLFGARLHLALNVLLKDDELEPALSLLAEPYTAGLDGLIVADLALAARVRSAYPDLELHASTQLDTHSSAQLEVLARLGFSRAILARELSLDEIAALDAHGLRLEAFVHGALCYGYSGACLLSSMASGRSGNRGRCSQACRMRYALERAEGVDAAGRRTRRLQRVLSTSDLAALAALPALLAAGVTSFKIEGRMKDAGYVAVATATYRAALDAALADPAGYAVRPEWTAQLEQSFSRGFSAVHLEGRHAELRGGGRGGHRGVQVGRVERVDEEHGEVTVRVARDHPLHEADVIQVYTVWGSTEPARLDGLLARGRPGGERVVLRLRERVSVKDRVFRISSGEMDGFAADAAAARVVARPVVVSAHLRGRAGEHPRLTLAGDGEEVAVEGPSALAPARTASLTLDRARKAIGALGGTPYRLGELRCDVDQGVFLGVGDLKELRRQAVAELDERRLGRRRRPVRGRPHASARPAGARSVRHALAGTRPAAVPAAHDGAARPPASPTVVLRVRAGEQPLALEHIDALCLDLWAGDDLEAAWAAAARARERGIAVRARSPEVLFDADLPWARAAAALPWDAVYARHVVALSWADRVVIEYPIQGLNAWLAPLLGVEGIVASPELSLAEIGRLSAEMRRGATLAAQADSASTGFDLEALVFGREQVLVTRDTLGLAEGLVDDLAVSTGPAGTTVRSAARMTLTDAKSFVFPVLVAAGETRIFNARVTNLCGRIDELRAVGVRGFLVVQADLVADERAAFVRGGLPGLAVFDDRERFTTGHLYRGVA